MKVKSNILDVQRYNIGLDFYWILLFLLNEKVGNLVNTTSDRPPPRKNS